jgi:hypothetical protein
LSILGTPSYMSPEQVSGGAVDARSDLFSLGILMYLLLTGKKPFVGDTAVVMFKIAYEDPIPPTAVNLELDPKLDYIVLRCLAKDRNQRYGSAREILADLDDFQQGRELRSKTNLPLLYAPPQAEPTEARPRPLPEVTPAVNFTISKKAWMAAGATVALVIALVIAADLGVGVYRLWTARPPSPTGLSTPPRVPRGLPGWPPESPSGYSPLPVLGDGLPLASPGQTSRKALAAASEAGTKPPRARKPLVKQEVVSPTSAELASAATPTQATHPQAAPSPAPVAAPPQQAASAVVTPKLVQLFCEYRLKEGTISVSSGPQLILEGKLRGKKTGGFLGIKGGHLGAYSHPINVPPDAHQLTVRVISSDGSVDLTGTIAASPPPGASPTLHIIVAPPQLKLDWQAGAHPTEK